MNKISIKESAAGTQERADMTVIIAKGMWDDRLKTSGKSVGSFIATDTTGFVSEFLAAYTDMSDGFIEMGYDVPSTKEAFGVEVTLS